MIILIMIMHGNLIYHDSAWQPQALTQNYWRNCQLFSPFFSFSFSFQLKFFNIPILRSHIFSFRFVARVFKSFENGIFGSEPDRKDLDRKRLPMRERLFSRRHEKRLLNYCVNTPKCYVYACLVMLLSTPRESTSRGWKAWSESGPPRLHPWKAINITEDIEGGASTWRESPHKCE